MSAAMEILAGLKKPWDEDGLSQALAAVAADCGFTHAAVFQLPPSDEDGTTTHYMLGNWSPSFRRAYEQHGLHRHKVVAATLSSDPMPFEWDIDFLYGANEPDASPGARMLLAEHYLEGVLLPVHGLTAFCGALSFAGPGPVPPERSIRNLHCFAFAFFGMLAAARFEENRRNNPLTQRERECLRQAMLGKTSSEIGGNLKVSEHTVTQHLTSAQRKLEASNRTQAVALAAQLGYLS